MLCLQSIYNRNRGVNFFFLSRIHFELGLGEFFFFFLIQFYCHFQIVSYTPAHASPFHPSPQPPTINLFGIQITDKEIIIIKREPIFLNSINDNNNNNNACVRVWVRVRKSKGSLFIYYHYHYYFFLIFPRPWIPKKKKFFNLRVVIFMTSSKNFNKIVRWNETNDVHKMTICNEKIFFTKKRGTR